MGGDLTVSKVELSTDFGATWLQADLARPVNRLAWQQWQGRVLFPRQGYYEVFARATDELGQSQPMLLPSEQCLSQGRCPCGVS